MRSCRLYQCSSKDKNTEEVIKPKESFNRRSCGYRNSLCAVRCECCAHRRPRRTSSRIMHKQKHLEVNGSDIETKRKKFRMAVKAPRSKNISRTNNQIETKGCNESCTSGTITMTPTSVSVEVVVATSPNNSHNFYPSEQDNAKTLSGQRTTRLRRRRRKFTTMKRNRRKTFSDSIKGTSIRQPSPLPLMNAEELVAESGGILTLEAVEDFSAVQMRVTNEIKSLQSQSCQIETVVLGNQFEIKPWYRGNYPAEYATLTKLHVCDGCFMYFRLEEVCLKHMRKCPLRGAPPGHEIYRDTHNNMSVFEVNGEKMPNYCANLCRLTMMWLGDKVVFADVEPFFFYILANSSEGFFKTLGYFSKQRNASFDQNLSCFCVFPCYQKMGLGTFLIDFSYLLSRLEFLPGGPERPLSTLGAIAYKNYWRNTIITVLYREVNENGVDEIDLSLSDISMRTGMREEDVAETIGMLFKCKRINKKAVTMFVNMGQLIAQGSKIVNLSRIMAVENYLDAEFLAEIHRRRIERMAVH